MTEDERYVVEQTIDEFEEYVREAETYVERAIVLQDSAKSTAKLVSFSMERKVFQLTLCSCLIY
jgi:hypothetical protein